MNFSKLTGFQRDLLCVVVLEGELLGPEIQSEMEEYYGQDVHHGRLYPNLDTIVKMGLLEKSQYDRRTNYYTATVKGHEVVEERIKWMGVGNE